MNYFIIKTVFLDNKYTRPMYFSVLFILLPALYNVFHRRTTSIVNTTPAIQVRVLHTAILNYFPQLKLHHIVVIADNENIYTIDFSPIHQSQVKTLLRLFFAQNVPAEIRIRHITPLHRLHMLHNDAKIIHTWNQMNQIDSVASHKLTVETFEQITNKETKEFISKIVVIPHVMNLYKYNCQHYSHFVRETHLLSNSPTFSE